MDAQKLEIIADGRRLDVLLSEAAGLTRSRVASLMEDGQVTEGFVSVAASSCDHNGHPVAAISLTVPSARPVTLQALSGRARDAVAELTRRLHGRST